MKKLMVLVLGVASIALITGCHKKETAEAPVQQQPMVSEQQPAVAAASATAVTEPVAPAATPVAAATTAVTQAANAAVEQVAAAAPSTDNPTPQQVQQALKNMGLYAGKIDGSLGPKTKKAIEEFQSRNGLNPDGKVGPKTWAKLSAHLTGPASVATEPIMPADASATGTTSEASN